MTSPDLLARLGVFVDEELLDAPPRRIVLHEMRAATGEPAEVYTQRTANSSSKGCDCGSGKRSGSSRPRW